jgi:hypothetical protein
VLKPLKGLMTGAIPPRPIIRVRGGLLNCCGLTAIGYLAPGETGGLTGAILGTGLGGLPFARFAFLTHGRVFGVYFRANARFFSRAAVLAYARQRIGCVAPVGDRVGTGSFALRPFAFAR